MSRYGIESVFADVIKISKDSYVLSPRNKYQGTELDDKRFKKLHDAYYKLLTEQYEENLKKEKSKEYKFPEILKELMKSNKLTQKQFGDKIGAAHNTVGNWERNENTPSALALMNMAAEFNVSVDYLLTGSDRDTLSEHGSSQANIWKSSGSR